MLSSPLTLHIINLPHLLLLPLLDLLLPIPPRSLLLFNFFLRYLIHLRDTLLLKLLRCLHPYHNAPLLPSPFPSTAAFTCCDRKGRGFLRIYSLHGGHPPWQLTTGLNIESATSSRCLNNITIPIVCQDLEQAVRRKLWPVEIVLGASH